MCGGGVDLNHTALTDLQQRLTAVEGSVGKVQQDVGKVQAEMMQGIPSGIKIKEIKSSSYNNMTPVLKVSGSGSVHFVKFARTGTWGKFAVKTDGVTRVEVVNGYTTQGFFSTLSSIYGVDDKTNPCNVFNDTVFTLEHINRYIDASTKGSQSISEESGSVVGNGPLVFLQSLEILIGPYGSVSEHSNGLVVAYTLDE